MLRLEEVIISLRDGFPTRQWKNVIYLDDDLIRLFAKTRALSDTDEICSLPSAQEPSPLLLGVFFSRIFILCNYRIEFRKINNSKI